MNRLDLNASNQIGSLESRLSARLAAALSEQAATLPHDIGERLRVMREQAAVRAREVRRPTVLSAAGAMQVAGGGTATLGGGPATWWMRLANIVPLLILAAGLFLVQSLTDREQVLAAADIDAVLLADELPPAAYSDPGFREFLRSPPP
jgi:hypothetical protein